MSLFARRRVLATPGERWATLLLVILTAAVGVLVGSSLTTVNYRPGADEGYYLRYAQTFATDGFHGLAQATGVFLAEGSGTFPPPIRLGYIVPAAIFVRLSGGGYRALSVLALTAHLTLILLTYLLGRRRLGAWPALAVTTLVASSPLLLGLSRRALADSVVTLLLAVAVWAWLEVLRPASTAAWSVGFGAAFCGAILAKESSVLFLVPFALLALVANLRAARPVSWARVALVGLAPAIAAGVAFSLLAGSPAAVVRLAEVVLAGPAHNAYAIAFGGGPWYRYVIDFLLLAPGKTLLAIAGLGWLAGQIARGQTAPALAADLAVFAAGTLAVFAPLTKNVRYLSVLELPIAVLAVVFLTGVLGPRRRRAGALLCGGVVLLLALGGFSTFERRFVTAAIYDPVTENLLREAGIVPAR